MPKNTPGLDDGDARTWRVTYQFGDNVVTQEVVALYHKTDDGLVTFKDNANAAVFTLAKQAVVSIERLRTAVLLAIGAEELEIILDGLAVLRANHGTIVPCDSDEASAINKHCARIVALAESLERLRPVAAERNAEDPCSMPRVPQLADA